MSNYSSLKSAIDANIKANGRREITGPVLNAILNAVVNSLGDGYLFRGVAIPSTNPGTPDQNVAYLAITEGTYTHMGGLSVTDGELSVFSYNGAWSKIPLALVPTKTSQLDNDLRFVTSEEMGESLSSKQDTIQDLSEIRSGAALGATAYQKPSAGIPASDMTDTVQQAISFAESTEKRSYNSSNPDGMGYLVLKKNKTFAEQVTEANTIYEIRDHFNLGGNSVNIPAGCTLKFNGGDISNGSVVYNNTEIQGNPIIDCTCTGGLRNSVVTPQMYGAKADGVTDDQVALNNAAKYNDSVFIPAGDYNVTEPITLKSNNTLFGVGRESRIRNSVVTGYNKFCVFTGGMAVGDAADSYLTLPSYACVVSADRLSLEMSDTSPFHVGDLIFVYKDETYSEKNPPHFWNAKIVGITTNESIKLDYYMDNDDLVGVNCLVKNMSILPQGSGHYPNVITENVCIHDLTLENIVDDGSGMYVMAIGSYGADIYNIWSHGNTIIGTNYCVNASFRNIVGEFDGSFIDCPEVNQNVEVAGCRVKRFGQRQNVIGMTFLQGYKAFVHDNRIDFGGAGKVGFGQHIRPIIKDNVFDNCLGSGARSIDLSSYGECIFTGNRVSTTDTNAIIDLKNSTGNIVCDNYFVNPNVVRWVQSFSTLDFGHNAIKNNYATKQTPSDSYYYRLPNTTIGTFLPHVAEVGSRTIAAGATYQAFAAPKLIYNARVVKISILLSKGNYSVKFTSSASSANTRTITLTNATWLEVYIFASSNYLNYKKDGDDAGVGRAAFNNHGVLAAIDITNNDQTDASLYTCLIEDIVP